MMPDRMIPTARLLASVTSRRRFLGDVGRFLVLAHAFPRGAFSSVRPRWRAEPFALGVASGEPLPDGVVLWTRLMGSPDEPLPARVAVEWEVAHDDAFQRIARRGSTLAADALGHSVHVEVDGLEPGRFYWYRFIAGGESSAIGRTRTAPAPADAVAELRFAFTSCQHYEQGLYTAYRHMAGEDLGFVVHLGDYIYENDPSDGRVRRHDAPEPVDLAGYRGRYELYKRDSDLQAAHAAFPWLVTWDDHEVENNYAADVPTNGIPRDAFLARRAAAYQAFYEHMPLRRASLPAGSDMRIYRRSTFGALIALHVLDGRQYRTDQPCEGRSGPRCAGATDPAATMLGFEQERWLGDGLASSNARWNVLANQTLFADYDSAVGPDERYNMDGWNGYAAARARLLDVFAARPSLNPVVLSGDIHNNWVCDLKTDFADPNSAVVGTEFACTSISSGGDGADTTRAGERALSENAHLRFYNNQRGYVRCTVTPERWRSEYRVLPFVTQPDAPIATRASWIVENGRPGAVIETGAGGGA